MVESYRIVGALGSPYTMKLRAILRYRRIPHRFELRNGAIREETQDVRPQMVPMMKYPNEDAWRVDSTPIALELEQRLPGQRSILPDDAVHQFLCALVEDFADEWLMKAMFHYRWYYAADRHYASNWIAMDQWAADAGGRAERKAFAQDFHDRQVGRMALVGCTDENRGVIEATYERVLDVLDPDVGYGRYLFGSRPSLADFGLFGQLLTLSQDPTGQTVMRQRAPDVSHWVRQLDDLSGLDGDWFTENAELPAALRHILQLCGETYLPFLAANEEALENGTSEVRLNILGRPYAQAPFRYQVKCYSRLKSMYAQLDVGAKANVDKLLASSACLPWLQ
jgi:glutathione S-transferase